MELWISLIGLAITAFGGYMFYVRDVTEGKWQAIGAVGVAITVLGLVYTPTPATYSVYSECPSACSGYSDYYVTTQGSCKPGDTKKIPPSDFMTQCCCVGTTSVTTTTLAAPKTESQCISDCDTYYGRQGWFETVTYIGDAVCQSDEIRMWVESQNNYVNYCCCSLSSVTTTTLPNIAWDTGQIYVDSVTKMSPTGNPTPGQTIRLRASVRNLDTVPVRGKMEVCVYPQEWHTAGYFSAFSVMIPEPSCCPSNKFCGGVQIAELQGLETDYVDVYVDVPSASTVDTCKGAGSAFSPSNTYGIVAGTYDECYTGYMRRAYGSTFNLAVTTTTTTTVYSPTTTIYYPTTTIYYPTTTTTIPQCVPNSACTTAYGCPGYRVCPTGECIDIPTDNCPTGSTTSTLPCIANQQCTTTEGCPGYLICPSRQCIDLPTDNCPGGVTTTTISQCGNGRCDYSETTVSCPVDCHNTNCGDRVCQLWENVNTCNVDCGSVACNPDGYCNTAGGETPQNCPSDCEGVVIPDEEDNTGLLIIGGAGLLAALLVYKRRYMK